MILELLFCMNYSPLFSPPILSILPTLSTFFVSHFQILVADNMRTLQCVAATDSARNRVRNLGEEVVRLNVSTLKEHRP